MNVVISTKTFIDDYPFLLPPSSLPPSPLLPPSSLLLRAAGGRAPSSCGHRATAVGKEITVTVTATPIASTPSLSAAPPSKACPPGTLRSAPPRWPQPTAAGTTPTNASWVHHALLLVTLNACATSVDFICLGTFFSYRGNYSTCKEMPLFIMFGITNQYWRTPMRSKIPTCFLCVDICSVNLTTVLLTLLYYFCLLTDECWFA